MQAVVLVPVQTGLGLSDEPAELVGFGPVSAEHARDLLAAAELRKACVGLTTGRMVALSDERVRSPVWSGRWWASAHPPTGLVEVLPDGSPHEPGPPKGPSGGRPPRPGPPRRPPSSVPLLDALLEMVRAPLPVESRVESRHDPSPGLADLVRFRDPRCVGPGCSTPSRRCDLDHVTPWPEGATSADNLLPASRRCHNAKTFGGWSYTAHPDGSVTWTTPWGATAYKPSRSRPVDLRDLRPRPVAPPPHQR
ncbi:MAG: HNH endonuclease signature motif containing protein [Mycobacteriales bacterium]